MRKSLPMNLHIFYVQLSVALISLAAPCAYASPQNESTYSDAVFAANAVKTPSTRRNDDDYSPYSYRDRYEEMNQAQLQKQRAYDEQKTQDAAISYIPRSNESDAEYQARMEKEQNPFWLKHQAQAKLKAQILDQQTSKFNQAAHPATETTSTPTDDSSSTPTEDQTSTPSNSLNELLKSSTSPNSIPREMTASKYTGYSLFYLLSIAWSLIFFVRIIRNNNE